MTRRNLEERRQTAAPGPRPGGLSIDRARLGAAIFVDLPLVALLGIALLRFNPIAWGTAWRSAFVLAIVLLLGVVFGRRSSLARWIPAMLALVVAFLVEHSDAIPGAWGVPGFAGRSLSPAALLLLPLGAAWAFTPADQPLLRSWSITISVTAMGMLVWVGGTTLLISGRGVIDPLLSATLLGRWLLIIVLFGAVLHAAGRDDSLAGRMGWGGVFVLSVGLVRAFL